MKLGLFNLPTSTMTFMEAVDYAKKTGIKAIEPYPSHEFMTPDIEAAKRIKSHADEIGIDICCFSMGVSITGDDSKEQIEQLKRYADVCNVLGSPYLHHTITPGLTHNFGRMPYSSQLKKAVASIQEIYDYAEQVGVKCVYENQGFVFNGCERFEMLLNTVDRDIRVVADLGNILFVNETPEEFVGRFAPYIAHVHLKDYLYKSGNGLYPGDEWYRTRNGDYLRGTVVGHGVINFDKIFRILASVGYDGYYSFEFDGIEDGLKAIDFSVRNAERYYNSI